MASLHRVTHSNFSTLRKPGVTKATGDRGNGLYSFIGVFFTDMGGGDLK